MISFDLFESFNINRNLLLVIGLWPYQRSNLARCQLILIIVILTSFITFQLMTFATAECTPELVIKVLSSTIFFFMYIIEYNGFWVNGQTVKYLMERLQQICNELRDENEIVIIKEYGSNAKLYTTVLTCASACSIFIVFSMPTWPSILNVILSANGSKVHYTTHIKTEYFVDSEKYFYLILLHMDASYFIGTIVVIATGTIFIAYIKYACGMFKIASYRIKQALSNDILREIGQKSEIKIHKEIIYAVHIHREAMKYSEFMVSSFEGTFISLVVFCVISLSFNLFLIFQILSYGGDIGDFLLYLIYIFVTLIYMFLANYIGQEVMDHNNHVFVTAYNVNWYLAPLHTQRMILLLLQRGNKAFNLNLGGLITGSLENFASLISVSISYFTVMYSTQQ